MPTGSSSQDRHAHLWAVTSYFNPVGYRRRLENYRRFRQHLQCPLIAVELSFGEPFELHGDDAEILIQLRGGDVMWQKERLLNIGFQAAPAAARALAWIDCDLLFEADDWPQRALRELERYPLVQPFTEFIHLERDQLDPPERPPEGRPRPADGLHRIHPGLGWVARRELLDKLGLYDAAILGSGDQLIVNAALGRIEDGEQAIRMNAAQRAHYRPWADAFCLEVLGQVGVVDQTAFHLWHGDRKLRGYKPRHEGLAKFDFDPAADIAIDENGCWRWNSDKPAMHRHVREYFFSRREDG